MKVTPFRLRLMAVWLVIRSLKVILRLAYLKYYNPLLEAYIRNPNLKWR